MLKKTTIALTICFGASLLTTPVVASDLAFKDRLERLIEEHNLARAAQLGAQSAQERIEEARGVLFPSLNVTSSIGKEDQINSGAANTALTPRDFNLTLTQRLYDFGASDATIARSEAQSRTQALASALTNQGLLLQGVIAQIEVIRALDLLYYAKKTEAAVAEQEARERAREEGQAGSVTDVLQVRAQLGVAKQARLVALQQYDAALNTFMRVFGDPADVSGPMEEPAVPKKLLPVSLEEAVEMARGRNLQLIAARGQAEILKKVAEEAETTAYSPTVDAIAEFRAKKDFGGVVGYEREALAKVQVSFPFNLGFTAENTISAADLDYQSSVLRADDVADQIEEQVRNAWQGYQTALRRYELGLERVDFARDFVDFALEERDGAERSIADVLVAQTQLNLAESDASSARRDITVSAFTLLSLISELSLDAVETELFDTSARDVALRKDEQQEPLQRLDGQNLIDSPDSVDPSSVPVSLLAETLPFVSSAEAVKVPDEQIENGGLSSGQDDGFDFWDRVHAPQSETKVAN